MDGNTYQAETPAPSASVQQAMPSSETREKRRRQPRNSACQPCAALKMKCVSGPVPGKCERCHRMDRDCIPSVPKPRKRHTLADDQVDPPPRTPSSIVKTSQSIPSAVYSERSRASLLSRSDLSHTASDSFTKLLEQGLGFDESSNALLAGIDYNYVQTSFTVFRQFASTFPFVSIRPDAEAVTLASDRPVTTLAICTVASSARSEMQERLAQAFRTALASKVILQGVRSLDLLVGMLVFLGWNHHYMSKQQIYQELCLLAGMAADLGLYQPRRRANNNNANEALERDRAFVGCYYLACGLSITGFNKPNPMRWTDNLRDCAQHVAYSGLIASDRALIGVTELMRAIDDMDDAIRTQPDTGYATAYVSLHVKNANYRLKALKRAHPELDKTLGLQAATIHFHHRSLRASDSPDTTALIQCACAIKEYLDEVLARPAITLHQIAIVDWTNLLEILVLMAKVSRPLPNTSWETGALSSMLQPEAVLDTICSHMASAPTGDTLKPRHEGQLQWFRGVCESIKKRILHERSLSGTSTLRGDESHYDTVHSLGRQKAPQQADGRFRPVNHPYQSELPLPLPGVSGVQNPPDDVDAFGMFEFGVLDDGFWNNFTAV